MNSLSDCSLLRFRPDTLDTVRKQYNLDLTGEMEGAIDILQESIKKLSHFVIKEFDRSNLERMIVFSKGSIEKAKLKLDNLCRMRTLMPEFFERLYIKSRNGIVDHALLPDMTPEHCRVYMLRTRADAVIGNGHTSDVIYNALVGVEYAMKHDYNAGFIAVIDIRTVNLKNVDSNVDFFKCKKFLTILREGYGFRIKELHLIHGSKPIENLITLLKSVFTAKLMSRTHVHTSQETLYNFVPKEILCKEYGGNAPSLSELYELTCEALNSEEHMQHMKAINQCRTDETKRINIECDPSFQDGTYKGLVWM